jgi:hypothetical protein
MKRLMRKYIETSGSKNTACPKLWEAANAVLKGELKTTEPTLKGSNTSISNLVSCLEKLGKEELAKLKVEK